MDPCQNTCFWWIILKCSRHWWLNAMCSCRIYLKPDSKAYVVRLNVVYAKDIESMSHTLLFCFWYNNFWQTNLHTLISFNFEIGYTDIICSLLASEGEVLVWSIADYLWLLIQRQKYWSNPGKIFCNLKVSLLRNIVVSMMGVYVVSTWFFPLKCKMCCMPMHVFILCT